MRIYHHLSGFTLKMAPNIVKEILTFKKYVNGLFKNE